MRLFAHLREAVGASSIERDVPDGCTVESAWQAFASEFPAAAPLRRTVAAAVNEEFSGFTTVLRDGDEVAWLPPVSGG